MMEPVTFSIQNGLGSFSGKTRVAFYLTAVMPYLVGIYLFFQGKIDVTEIILLYAALALFSMLTGFALLRQSGEQLQQLVRETQLASKGMGPPITLERADLEISDIATHFNVLIGKMQVSDKDLREQSVQLMTYARDLVLAHQKAKDEERLRLRLSRYVGQALVEKLSNTQEDFFENEKKEATVLFADIRGFTGLAEKLPTEELIDTLNEFFDRMVEVVFAHNGVLDKFVGDQLVAVFGLLSSATEPEQDALRAALEMQRATGKMMARRQAAGKTIFAVGIGINTGNLIVGNIGSRSRMDYTVMGDCVNVAAHLQQVAAGGEIIAGRETCRRLRRFAIADKRMQVRAKSRAEALTCYRIRGIRT